MIEKAAQSGIIINAVPFIQIRFREDRNITEQLEKLSGRELLAIVTSSNAVKAILRTISPPQCWKVACIEGATYHAVSQYWNPKNILYKGKNAAILSREITGNPSPLPAYFFCGHKRSDDLPLRFKDKSIALREIVVYDTLFTPQAADKHYDGILFFSPAAAESFFSANKVAPNSTLFAIGPATAQHIRLYAGQNVPVVTSEIHSQRAMIDLLIRYYTG